METAAPECRPAAESSITVIRPAPGAERPPAMWHHADVLEHREVGTRYRHLRLYVPGIAVTARPGQFVMLTAARPGETDPVLPRPMAVYRRNTAEGSIEIVYGVVGSGTRQLSTFRPGEQILTVGPLGQGFQLDQSARRVLLVGRGIGTCSLTTIAEGLAGSSTEVVAVTSGRDEAHLVGGDLYRQEGAVAVYEVSDQKGNSSVEDLERRLVADLDADPPQQIMTCGSERLARLCASLGDRWSADVQVSLEAHMACGLGYCHGCASGSRGGAAESPLVCKDGPVFRLHGVREGHACR